MAERSQQWMPSRLWPSRKEIALEEAYDQAAHDLWNGFEDANPVNEHSTPKKDYGALVGRIRGWRWEQVRSRIFARDNYLCVYCGSGSDRLECDHIIPITRGGTNDDENLATACFPCNRSKRTKLLSEWVHCNGK